MPSNDALKLAALLVVGLPFRAVFDRLSEAGPAVGQYYPRLPPVTSQPSDGLPEAFSLRATLPLCEPRAGITAEPPDLACRH
jgi:hypothetical protein